LPESKRSHRGTAKSGFVSRQTSDAKEPPEKIYEIRVGVAQLIVVVAISVLLILGLYSYALAYQAPFHPLAQITRPMTIQSITFQDISGNPRSPAIFARGETVVVNVTVSYPSDTYFGTTLNFLQIAEIWEPPPTPPYGPFTFIGFFFGSINQGQQVSSGVGWAIPAQAATGVYTVEVFVWNKWGGSGWSVYADPQTATFTVS